jgi:hypothetical protein
MEYPTFSEWMKEHCNQCGKPSKPSEWKNVSHDEKVPPGVRDGRDDLKTMGSLSNYPGNISYQGDVGPYRLSKKTGKKPPGPGNDGRNKN